MGAVVEVVGHKDMPANLVALDVVVLRGGRAAPQRIYQLLDLIRNKVIRKDTSPLPRPEEGLEKLELDHGAIYRMIAERDEAMAKEAELAEDFEFAPQEPVFDEDEQTDDSTVPAKRRRRRRRRRRKPDGEVTGSDESALSSDDDSGASEHEEGEAFDPNSPEGTESEELTAEELAELERQAEQKRGGFVGWMKRIFTREEDEELTTENDAFSNVADADIGPIDPPVVESSSSEETPDAADSDKASHAESESLTDEEKPRRRRRRRRRRSPRSSSEEGQEPSSTESDADDGAEMASESAEAESQDGKKATASGRTRTRRPRRPRKPRTTANVEDAAENLARDAARAVAELEASVSKPADGPAADVKPPPLPPASESERDE
jgi:ribonuclease E